MALSLPGVLILKAFPARGHSTSSTNALFRFLVHQIILYRFEKPRGELRLKIMSRSENSRRSLNFDKPRDRLYSLLKSLFTWPLTRWTNAMIPTSPGQLLIYWAWHAKIILISISAYRKGTSRLRISYEWMITT